MASLAHIEPFWDDRYTAADPGPYQGELYAPNAWDTGIIAGVQLPGIVSVSAALSRHFDVISAPGTQPQLRIYGYEALRFNVSIKVWTPAQWNLLQVVLSTIQPDSATAFDIYTPWCATMGIKSAICSKKGPLSGEQVKTLSLELIRWRRGKSAVATTNKSRQRADEYNYSGPATSQVSAANGTVTTMTPTQGPQVAPSSAPSLVPVP